MGYIISSSINELSGNVIIEIVTKETPRKLSTWNFDMVIFVHVCEDFVSPGYHFVTAGGGHNVLGSILKYFCIINKERSYWATQNFFQGFCLLCVK